jgi:hypothetical protein
MGGQIYDAALPFVASGCNVFVVPEVSRKGRTATCGVRQALPEHFGVCQAFFSEAWVMPDVELSVVGIIQVLSTK